MFTTQFKIIADLFLINNSQSNRRSIGSFFLENKISEIALAYWFMDDGGLLSYNKDYIRKGLVLNTQGFTVDEVNLLSKNINSTFFLNTWVRKNKAKPIIAFSGKEYNKVKPIIYSHVVSSMRYKLPCSYKSEHAPSF